MYKKFALGLLILPLFLVATPVIAKGEPSPLPGVRRGLTDIRLRSCQARESSIKNRMNALTRLVANIEDKFGEIATRVENFYTSSGKTISNYDALVADISAKKTLVDTDLASAKTDESSFSCTADDPKTLLTQFRTDMQKVKSDLKAYRTSIKNLIVAVRPLASESPKPTATP